ncbi:hypothetical protein [Streptomyces flaveus]|uniref:Uncharacterized protein n=1 Tax=Streptomyces flaveus TaxID=66370 RepID=A0A917VK03_9ACTN|nr:hypothetical protein [Streptomyces flaveus]GGK88608.1 hypothetical protein GCM10010094_57160 [Streptomyces flaveus]
MESRRIAAVLYRIGGVDEFGHQQIDGILSERFSLLTPIRVEAQPTANGHWLVCITGERR